MIEFDFIIGTYDDSIDQIAMWLGSRPKDNLNHFDEINGNGYLLITELEKGFFIKAWDYTLKEDTKFNIRPAHVDYPVIFMINYLLTPDGYWLETGADKKINKLNNIMFFSNKNEFSFNVRAGHKVKALDICFTYEWLQQQYPASRKDHPVPFSDSQNQQQPVIFETFSVDDFRIVNEIMENAFNNDWEIIFFKSRVLTLVDELLKNIFSKANKETGRTHAHTEVMMEVERKLNSILHEKLPNLKEIAKEFSMSDSTLKRQFKQVYGKAIYEYYLYKKMELAKRMLLEKDMTISQVAYSLGYEKASPFIRVFKKQFGVSPGSLRTSHNTLDLSRR